MKNTKNDKTSPPENDILSPEASISLRTNAMSIVGLIQLLRNTELSHEQEEYISMLETCNNGLIQLTYGLEKKTEPEQPVAATEAAASQPGGSLLSISGIKILLAEDNALNSKVIRKMLNELGGLVDVAANGQIACERIKVRPYDLVLMDCEMPLMDGYEATQHIRASGKTDLPIIALTAHASPEARKRCKDVGMNAFLTKPICRDQLCQRIVLELM